MKTHAQLWTHWHIWMSKCPQNVHYSTSLSPQRCRNSKVQFGSTLMPFSTNWGIKTTKKQKDLSWRQKDKVKVFIWIMLDIIVDRFIFRFFPVGMSHCNVNKQWHSQWCPPDTLGVTQTAAQKPDTILTNYTSGCLMICCISMTFVSSCSPPKDDKTASWWLYSIQSCYTWHPNKHSWLDLFVLAWVIGLDCAVILSLRECYNSRISDFHQASSSEGKHVTFERSLWRRHSSGWQTVRRAPGVYCNQREDPCSILKIPKIKNQTWN